MTAPVNSEFKVPSIPARALCILSEAAEMDPERVYSRCTDLMDSLEFEDKPIRDFFCTLCGEVTVNNLKQKFTREQIAEINAILEWYHLIMMGCLPEKDGYKDEPGEIKKFLGISSYVEIVSPSVKLMSKANPLAFEDVLALVEPPQNTCSTHYFAFLQAIQKALLDNASADMAATNVELFVDFWVGVGLKDCLGKMEVKERLRWTLFISIVSQYSNEAAFVADLASHVANRMPSDISDEMKQQLRYVTEALAKSNQSQGAGAAPATYRPPALFAKMDILGLPNWMPNAGNTCYISATLWALFVLLDAKVQQKIEAFTYASPAENAALNAFKGLYAKISANEISNISRLEVNDFRTKMQAAFPTRFMAPFASSQEDAYEFLAATMRDLLGLDCTSDSAAKFIVLHTFARVNDEPLQMADLYDYTKALAPSYNKQLSYVLDIRLDEQVVPNIIFKDLVTTVRQTDVVERNAYLLQQTPEAAKYQSVQTQHTEQFMVESKALAPEYFCGRVTRFSVDYTTGMQHKRFDHITPSASLQFHTKQTADETVAYDLAAICVHSGYSINAGHYYTYFRKQIDGVYKWFKYDDIHGPELCHNEQQVLLDVAKNGYIYYYKKRAQDATPPPELVIKEPYNQAKEWVKHKLGDAFCIDESKGCHPAFSDQAQEAPSFRELAEKLNQAIYLVDPSGDRDLHILEDGHPIPGDFFRYGEQLASNGIQYIYKQQDGSYLVLAKCQMA